MPSGAKRRKAAKRRKEKEEKSALQSSSTSQIGTSDDDPRSQDDKGSDSGDANSPTKGRSGNDESSSASFVGSVGKADEGERIGGSRFGGESQPGEVVVMDVVVGAAESDELESRDVKIDFVGSVKRLNSSSSSSSSSSSDSNSDEEAHRFVEKKDLEAMETTAKLEAVESVKEVVVVAQEEGNHGPVVDLPQDKVQVEEKSSVIDDSRSKDSEENTLGVEEISRNGGEHPKDEYQIHELESDRNVTQSGPVASLDNHGPDKNPVVYPRQGAVQVEEKSIIDNSQSKNTDEKTLAAPVVGQGVKESSSIGGEHPKDESETVKSKDVHVHELESDKNARDSDAVASLDNEQHQLPVAPPTIRPTSWKSCCGLFEVLMGSSR